MGLRRVNAQFSDLKPGNLFYHNGQALRKVSATMAIDENDTTHIIAGDPKVKVVRFGAKKGKFIRGSGAKAKWKHDTWTLATLYERYQLDPVRGPIVRSLQYLRSNMSVGQVVMALKYKKQDIQNWVKRYNKDGLAVMLGVDVVVPANFANSIERYLLANPTSLRKVLSVRNDSLLQLADEIGVEDYALDRWALRRLVDGGDMKEYKP